MFEPTPGTKEDETKTTGDVSNFWQTQLALADKDQQDWNKDALAVVSRYKNEKKAAARSDTRRFNILFSNTETLKSALYGKTAKPDVRRRFADKDPIARTAAEVIERALIDCSEVYDVDKPIEKGLHDYLLPGRGVVRIEYEPVMGERPAVDMLTGQPKVPPVMEKYVADQIVRERYVYWDDYRQAPARVWDDVWWVAFRHLMTRKDLTDNKFENAGDIPLNWAPMADDKRPVPDDLKRAEVWEIWDERKKQRIWIVKGHDQPLRSDDDPYGLEGFFPLPEPLVSFGDTATLVPTPEFHAYRDQADDLDENAARISRLTRALKRRGVYDKAVKELSRLKNAADNEFIPVDNYQVLASKGGLEAAFQTEDISLIAIVLRELYVQRDQLIQGIYELTGIADIMRGDSDPNETLGAQKLKAQFGSTRMKRRQRAVQKWIASLYKLKAEIIAEHFEPEVLQQMTGQQIDPQVMELLRSDKLRSYRIDIETDSTVFEDAEADKQATTEMITGVVALLEKGLPAVQQQPELAPLFFEILSVGLRAFKKGKELEDVLEQTKEQVTQAMSQPKPDPKVAAEQAKMQADAQAQQQQMALDQQKLQMEGEAKKAELTLKAQIAAEELQLNREIAAQEAQIKRETAGQDMALKERQFAHEQQRGDQEAAFRQQEMADNRETSTRQGDLEERKLDATNTIENRKLDAVEKPGLDVGNAVEHVKQISTENSEAIKEAMAALKEAVKIMAAPKRHVRGTDGRITHSEPMVN